MNDRPDPDPVPAPVPAAPPPADPTAAMAAELSRAVRVDDAGRLDEDIICRRCQYALRGLPVTGRCPECGSSVGWSVRGDLLRYSDPDWVDHLAGGALWLIVAIFLQIGAVIVGSILDEAVGASGGVTAGGGLVAAIIGVIAYWKLTMADPGAIERSTVWTVRQMTRVLVFASILAAVLEVVTILPAFSTASMQTAGGVGTVALLLVSTAATILLFIHMGRIAHRIPDPMLISQTKVVMWGTVASYLIVGIGGALVGAIVAVAGGVANTGAPTARTIGSLTGLGIGIAVSACVAVVLLLTFGIWWMVLLFIYRVRLLKAARLARETWMRDGGDDRDDA